jgi:hypothetical protein
MSNVLRGHPVLCGILWLSSATPHVVVQEWQHTPLILPHVPRWFSTCDKLIRVR